MSIKKIYIFVLIALLVLGTIYFNMSGDNIRIESRKSVVVAPKIELSKASFKHKFDRYETTQEDCKGKKLSKKVSFHEVAVISIYPSQKIVEKDLNKIELVDKVNSIKSIYTFDHKRSNAGKLFYFTSLFGKDKHYEYTVIDKDEDGFIKNFHIFFPYREYTDNKAVDFNSNSNIALSGFGNKNELIFKTISIDVDYIKKYELDKFPKLLGYKVPSSKDKVVLEMDYGKHSGNGDVQYKASGVFYSKEFFAGSEKQKVEVKIDPYDTYLAVILDNEIGYENKIVLYRDCDEFY